MLSQLEEILKKCVKNDQQAQAVLYDWLAPKLLGLCLRYFRNRDEAEDVMQDSMVKIFMNLGSYRAEGNFEGWCRRIAVNTALNRLKQSSRLRFESGQRQLELLSETETETEKLQPDEQQILDCLAQLAEGYRTIINLFLFENLTHREIAEKLGISESTSRSQYARGRHLLAELVKQKLKANETKYAE